MSERTGADTEVRPDAVRAGIAVSLLAGVADLVSVLLAWPRPPEPVGLAEALVRVEQHLHLIRTRLGVSPDAMFPDLSPAQGAVALLVAEGLTNKAIAERLGVSTHTVESHVKATLTRLKLRGRAALAAEATRRLGMQQAAHR